MKIKDLSPLQYSLDGGAVLRIAVPDNATDEEVREACKLNYGDNVGPEERIDVLIYRKTRADQEVEFERPDGSIGTMKKGLGGALADWLYEFPSGKFSKPNNPKMEAALERALKNAG